jgi:drug/metabolite transporter (DMT)-like permease
MSLAPSIAVPRASAADLKSLRSKRRIRLSDFKSKSGTRIISLLVPAPFRSSRKGVAATDRELRKAGTSFNPLPLTIALFCLLWSFAFVAGKIAVTDCPPLILLTARFSLAGLLILGISAVRREPWTLTWRDAAVFAVLGVANNALYLGLGYTGLKSISAGLGGLVVSANPVFTAALAALFLGEALTWRKVAGLVLGVAGVGLIVWHRVSVGTDSLHGILFTLASLASIVAGTILFKLLAPKGSLWVGNGIQNLAGGLVLLPLALAFADVGDVVPSAGLFGAFAFLVLGGSILAYLLWFHLLKVCGATAASAYHFLMPPLGMLFAFLVLGEHVEFRDLLGIVPVALGIYLVTRPAAAVSPSMQRSNA